MVVQSTSELFSPKVAFSGPPLKITAPNKKKMSMGFAAGDTPAIRTLGGESETSRECPREASPVVEEEVSGALFSSLLVRNRLHVAAIL
jgi:hypothetical protein